MKWKWTSGLHIGIWFPHFPLYLSNIQLQGQENGRSILYLHWCDCVQSLDQ